MTLDDDSPGFFMNASGQLEVLDEAPMGFRFKIRDGGGAVLVEDELEVRCGPLLSVSR